jgi:hypothetical protein
MCIVLALAVLRTPPAFFVAGSKKFAPRKRWRNAYEAAPIVSWYQQQTQSYGKEVNHAEPE